MRVLAEETSVRSVAQVLAEAPGWFTYELPAALIGVALKGQYCGQRQKWLAVRFPGDDDEIDISAKNGHKAGVGAAAMCRAGAAPQAGTLPGCRRHVCAFSEAADCYKAVVQRVVRAASALPWFVALFG